MRVSGNAVNEVEVESRALRSPYERYERYTVVSCVEGNAERLASLELPESGLFWTSDYRRYVRNTAPIDLTVENLAEMSPWDESIATWVEEEGFRELLELELEPESSDAVLAKEAISLFCNPETRQTLSLLLPAQMSREEVANHMRTMVASEISVDLVRLYQKLFWDWDALESSNQSGFLSRLVGNDRWYATVGALRPSRNEAIAFMKNPSSLLTVLNLQDLISLANLSLRVTPIGDALEKRTKAYCKLLRLEKWLASDEGSGDWYRKYEPISASQIQGLGLIVGGDLQADLRGDAAKRVRWPQHLDPLS
tara:strand:+ start:53920 stop:54849 length:930 start_codon:yes stop_codon:yes gene_type:complete